MSDRNVATVSVYLFTVPVNLVKVKLWLTDVCVWCSLEQSDY